MGKYQSGQMGQTVNLLSFDFGGSNPSLPTKIAEVAQLIEHEPSKLRVAGLSPVFRSTEEMIKSSLLLFYILPFLHLPDNYKSRMSKNSCSAPRNQVHPIFHRGTLLLCPVFVTDPLQVIGEPDKTSSITPRNSEQNSSNL